MSGDNHTPGYELSGIIGVGKFGVVYRARDISLGHDVALKVIHPNHATERWAADRLIREVRLIAQLMHPGLPAVHALDVLPDGRPFFVMKLIRGRTVAEIVEGQLPSVSSSLTVLENVCQAVGYAHCCGVIHCDLEPSNVMMGSFGEVVVLDWELAKVMPGAKVSQPEPYADFPTGTPAFTSPEQARGDRQAVDERSDVFGLGALLCFMLTGQPPYTGADESEVRQKACAADLADAHRRLVRCGTEPALTSLCRRCLSFDPKDRPADALEVAKVLARIRSAT
jgi:serine/threonine protein kinase